MKKIVSLLFIGVIGLSFQFPNAVSATETTASQKVHLSNNIGPLSADEFTVTLKNGETFEKRMMTAFMEFYDPEFGTGRRCLVINVQPLDPNSDVFSVHSSVPTCSQIEPYDKFYVGSNTNHFEGVYDFCYRPITTEVHDVIFKLTNYSAGPVTYKVKLQFSWIMPY